MHRSRVPCIQFQLNEIVDMPCSEGHPPAQLRCRARRCCHLRTLPAGCRPLRRRARLRMRQQDLAVLLLQAVILPQFRLRTAAQYFSGRASCSMARHTVAQQPLQKRLQLRLGVCLLGMNFLCCGRCADATGPLGTPQLTQYKAAAPCDVGLHATHGMYASWLLETCPATNRRHHVLFLQTHLRT